MSYGISQIQSEMALQAQSDTRRLAWETRDAFQALGASVSQVFSTANLAAQQAYMQAMAAGYRATVTAGQAFATMSGQLGPLSQKLGVVSATALSAAAGLRHLTKDALEFDRQLGRIESTTGDSSVAIQALSTDVSKLSRTWGVNAVSMLGAAGQFRALGKSADDVKTALEGVAAASKIGTFGDFAQTARASINVARQFKQSGAELVSTLGSIHAVGRDLGVDSGAILEATGRLGNAFRRAGGSATELVALLGVLKSQSADTAAQLGSHVQVILSRIERPAALDSLRAIGLELRNEQGNFVGLFETLKRIDSLIGHLPATDSRVIQIGEIFGVRSLQKVLPLLQEATSLERAHIAALYGSSSASGSAEKQMGRYAERLNQVKSNLADVARQLLPTESVTIKLAEAFSSLATSASAVLPALAAVGAIRATGLSPAAIGGLTAVQKKSLGRNLAGFGLLAAGTTAGAIAHSYATSANQHSTAGLISGGLTGAGVGFALGGPYAAAGGLLIGSILGMVSAMRDAEKQIRALGFDKDKRAFQAEITALSSGGSVHSEANLLSASNHLEGMLVRAEIQARENVPAGGNLSDLSRSRVDAVRSVLGKELTDIGVVLHSLVGERVKQGASPAESVGGVLASHFGRAGSRALAAGSGKSLDDIRSNLLAVGTSAARQSKQLELAASATAHFAKTLYDSSAIVSSLTAARLRSDHAPAAAVLTNIFEGKSTAIHSETAGHVGLLGGADRGLFLEGLAKVTAPLGSAGAELSREARSVDALVRELPHVLAQEGRKSFAEGPDFADRVVKALGGRGIEQAHLASLRASLVHVEDSSPAAIGQRLRNVSSFSNDLTKDIVGPIKQSLQHAAHEIDQQAHTFVTALSNLNQQAVKVDEQRARLDDLTLEVQKNAALRFAQAVGRPSQAADILPLSTVTHPQDERVRRAAGLGGASLDPNTLALSLRDSLRRLEGIRARRDETPPRTPEWHKLAVEFSNVESKTLGLRHALELMTDATARNAAAQDRLTRIEAERTSRLSIAERVLTGGPRELARLSQGATAVGQAVRQGGFHGQGPEHVQAAIQFLDATHNVQLPAFGNILGQDLKRRLLERTLPGIAGLPPIAKQNERQSKGVIDANIGRSAQAQEKLVQVLGELHGKLSVLHGSEGGSGFLRGLDSSFHRFLDALRTNLLDVEVARHRSRLAGLEVERAPLLQKQKQAELLTSLGIRPENLTAARAPENISLLQNLARSAREAKDLEGARIGQLLSPQQADFDRPLHSRRFSPGIGIQERLDTSLRKSGVTASPEDVKEILQRYSDKFLTGPNPQRTALRSSLVGRPLDEQKARLDRFESEALTSVAREVIQERAKGKAAEVAGGKEALGRRLGLDQAQVERLLVELSKNQEGVVSALRSVESMEKLASSVERIAIDIRATQQAIERLHPSPAGPPVRRASGGFIPGVGNNDSVNVLATPGEFIVRKSIAEQHGDQLEKLNQTGRLSPRDIGGLVGPHLLPGFGGVAANLAPDPSLQERYQIARHVALLQHRRKLASLPYAGRNRGVLLAQLRAEAALLSENHVTRAGQAGFISQLDPYSRAIVGAEQERRAGVASTLAGASDDQLRQHYTQVVGPTIGLQYRSVARQLARLTEQSRQLNQQGRDSSFLSAQRDHLQAQLDSFKGFASNPRSVGSLSRAELLEHLQRAYNGPGLPSDLSPYTAKVAPALVGPPAPRPATSAPITFGPNARAKPESTPKAAPVSPGFLPGPIVFSPGASPFNPFGQSPGGEAKSWIADKRRQAEQRKFDNGQLVGPPRRFAQGGVVPGPQGAGDVVPALLSPGEFVVPKALAQARNTTQTSPAGDGGLGRQMAAFQQPATSLAGAMAVFSREAESLSKALQNVNGFRMDVHATHRVEVVHNGVEMFQQLEPVLRQMVVETTEKSIIQAFRSSGLPMTPVFNG